MECFPRNYQGVNPSAERALETVKHLEENLTDRVTVHRANDCVMLVGNAIKMLVRRHCRGHGEATATDSTPIEADPTTEQVGIPIQTMVDSLCGRNAAA